MKFIQHGIALINAFAHAIPQAWPRPRTVAAWFCMALLVRLIIAVQPLATLDRTFIPDDTYYSLAIAHHIATLSIPSTDGVIPTNGFQPLITLLEVPFFWLGASLDQAAYGAVAISVLCGAAAVAALATLAAISAGAGAGWLAAVIATIHTALLRNDLSGMEASLAGFLGLLCVLALYALPRRSEPALPYCFGLLCGAAMLARVDTMFLIAGCFVLLAVRLGWRAAAAGAAGAATILLPWAVWINATTGAIFPESGRAVRQLVAFHEQYDVNALATTLISFCELGRAVPIDGTVSLHAAIAGMLVMLFLLAASLRARATPLHAFLLASVALGGIYFLYLPAFWFLARYLHPVFLASIAVWSAYAVQAWHRNGVSRALAVAVTCVLLAAGLRQLPSMRGGAGDAFHGFRAPTLALLPYLAPYKHIGAVQSGALAYYAPAGTQIVNLDGVVNRNAYYALRDGTLDSYMRQAKIEAVADYDFSTPLFKLRAAKPPNLTLVTRIPDTRTSKLALYTVAW